MRFHRPVDSKFPISSPFGTIRKLTLYNNQEKKHNGIDFATPEGTFVYSLCDGSIFQAGWQDKGDEKKGFGLRVWQITKIGDDYFDVFYAHLSKIECKCGDEKMPGGIIGFSGNTGSSTGPHLHVGLRNRRTQEWCNIEFL